MVSHELRTPLNAITGWTGMLLEGTLDAARTQRALETIERNARSQVQLIDDLLDISRIVLSREEGGRLPAVALTAYARLEDRTRALRAGFDSHVAKPVDPSELLAVLASITAR